MANPPETAAAPLHPPQRSSPHQRLRWALHSALLMIALLLAAAGWTAWQGEQKSASALQDLGIAAACGALLLLGLAGGVVEPAVRRLRRQHQHLTGQAMQLERLALVAERTHNMVVITDASRRITWANDAFSRVSGYALADALGRKPAELLQTAQTDAATVQRMRQAMDAGQGVRVELLNRSRHGRSYWLDIDIQPLHGPAGALTGFIAVQTDITEQVYQRQRLRTLLDALPTGVVEADASGAIIDANTAAERVLGLTHAQLLDRNAVDPSWRTVRDDQSPYPASDYPMARSLRDGASVHSDSLGVLTPAGEQRWLMVSSEPLRSPAGAVTGAVACFADVTDQRAQRTLLQLTLQAADIGTWQWRLDSGDRQWSAVSCRMLGYSAEEFSPLLPHWRERVHPDDKPQAEQRLRQHLDDPSTPYRTDMRIRHRAGHWVWVQTFGTVVERNAAGRAQRMVGVHLDISERKRHEQRLQANALCDHLTGLPNRAALMQALQAAITAATATTTTITHQQQRDPQRRLALLFLDFDRFKQVNDQHGHAAGDELLRQIAQRLRRALGQVHATEGSAARLGGDEFVVLLVGMPHTSTACVVAETLLQALAQPYDLMGQRVLCSASIGIAIAPLAGGNPDHLLRDADSAMYAAKQGGRSRWVLFEPQCSEGVDEMNGTRAGVAKGAGVGAACGPGWGPGQAAQRPPAPLAARPAG